MKFCSIAAGIELSVLGGKDCGWEKILRERVGMEKEICVDGWGWVIYVPEQLSKSITTVNHSSNM